MSPPAADRALFVWPTAVRPADPVELADVADSSVLWLRTAPGIVYPPPISQNNAIIFAADYDDPDDIFSDYPSADDYLVIIDGQTDIRAWGPWIISNKSGTPGRYRTIRAFNVAVDWMHPWDRRGSSEVLVDSFQFTNDSAYWMVIGFSQQDMPTQNDVRDGAHHIIFSRLLVQGQIGNYTFQARAGDECIVQQCAVLDPAVDPTTGAPIGGLVAIKPDPLEGNQTGFKSLDNEVRNCVDALLVGYNAAAPYTTEIDVHSEGNDYYADGTRTAVTGLAAIENGIDIKGSSTSVQSVSRRDRIWGMRRYVGHAEGDALQVHRWARNWLFDQIFIDDCRFGFFETNWDAPIDLETPRNIVITDGQFTRIRATSVGAGAGAIFRVLNNLNVSSSWFADSDGIVFVSTTMRAGGPSFNDNTATSTATDVAGTVASPYIANDNLVGDPQANRQYIQCQRWTGGGVTFRRGAKITDVQLDREPVAAFSAMLTVGDVAIAEEIITYGGATIVSRNWSWGDGSADDTGANPTHAYPGNGIYTITLDIEDSNGLTHKTQRHVQVTAMPAPSMPRFRTEGTLLEGIAGGTPGAPDGCVERELLVCWGLAQGTEPPTFADPNGFEQIPGSPFDGGLASSSSLLVALRRVGAGETAADWAPTFNDPGNHLMARVLRYDRVRDTVDVLDVINAIASAIVSTSTVSGSIPGATSTEPNCLVLGFNTTGADSDLPQFSDIATAAPHLANTTVRFNDCTSQGNGSGLLMLEGEKAAQGAYGGWTEALAAAFRQVQVSIALLGELP